MRHLNVSEVEKVNGGFVVQGLSGSVNALAAGWGYIAAGGDTSSPAFSKVLGGAFIAGAISPARTAATLGSIAVGGFVGSVIGTTGSGGSSGDDDGRITKAK